MMKVELQEPFDTFPVKLCQYPEFRNELCSICHEILSKNNPTNCVICHATTSNVIRHATSSGNICHITTPGKICHPITPPSSYKLVHPKHIQCLREWFNTSSNPTCPDCRVPINLSICPNYEKISHFPMGTPKKISFFFNRVYSLFVALAVLFIDRSSLHLDITPALLNNSRAIGKSAIYATMISGIISAIAYKLGHQVNAHHHNLEIFLTQVTVTCCSILFFYSTTQK